MFFLVFSLAKSSIYEDYFGNEVRKNLTHKTAAISLNEISNNFLIQNCCFKEIHDASIAIQQPNSQSEYHVLHSGCTFTDCGQCVYLKGSLQCVQHRFYAYTCYREYHQAQNYHVTLSTLSKQDNNQKNSMNQSSIYNCGIVEVRYRYPIIIQEYGAVTFDNTNATDNKGNELFTQSSTLGNRMSYSLFFDNDAYPVLFNIKGDFMCERCIFDKNYNTNRNAPIQFFHSHNDPDINDFYYKESNFLITSNEVYFYELIGSAQNNTFLIHCYVDDIDKINTNLGSIHLESIENQQILIQISSHHWIQNCDLIPPSDQPFYGKPKLQDYIKELRGDHPINKKML